MITTVNFYKESLSYSEEVFELPKNVTDAHIF